MNKETKELKSKVLGIDKGEGQIVTGLLCPKCHKKSLTRVRIMDGMTHIRIFFVTIGVPFALSIEFDFSCGHNRFIMEKEGVN